MRFREKKESWGLKSLRENLEKEVYCSNHRKMRDLDFDEEREKKFETEEKTKI